ncbi:MAG: hypothetical protein Q9168_005606 [Polycauliona sp. 1 TL-2023]
MDSPTSDNEVKEVKEMKEMKSEANLEGTPDLSEKRVAPDTFEERYATTTKEIYAYYCLVSQAAGDAGVLHFAGKIRNVNSIVLLSNGISFAIQIVVFLIVGSFADFGYWRPNVLIIQSIFAYALGFAWLGVHDSSKWEVGAGLYIVGLIAYQTTFTFWNAAFPGLARNTPEMKDKADAYVAGTITRDDYDYALSLRRGSLANVAFVIQSAAEVLTLAIIIGIMFGLKVRDSEANNNWGFSAIIAFGSAIWLVTSLPWFFLEKRRPGQDPGKRSIIIAGFWQLWHACQAIWQLRQSLIYLVGYFLLGDSLNTSITVIYTLQAEVVAYDTLTLTYLLIVAITAQGIGIYVFWWVHRRFQLSTKTVFDFIAAAIVGLDVWGMIGIWTPKFGFKNKWEFWLFQVYYGGIIGPWYTYSQIMIAEVTPRDHEFLFFSLFSIVGKTSSFIGPLVSSAIIDASPTHNNSMPFYFLFGLSLVSALGLMIFVDLKKSQKEQTKFLADKAKKMQDKLELEGTTSLRP